MKHKIPQDVDLSGFAIFRSSATSTQIVKMNYADGRQAQFLKSFHIRPLL
jgi:hypothetical protein